MDDRHFSYITKLKKKPLVSGFLFGRIFTTCQQKNLIRATNTKDFCEKYVPSH
jgi:hypothetical protein